MGIIIIKHLVFESFSCIETAQPVLCRSFRTVHGPPGGHHGFTAEAGRASGPQVSWQEPGKCCRHQTHLQPRHQTQHRSGSTRSNR